MIDEKISDRCFASFRDYVHKLTGITIDKNRSAMLVGRIRKRVFDLGLSDYDSYLDVLKNSKEEELFFTDLITTNETYFYRTPRIWDFIENEFMPKHFSENSKLLKAWSAASSTGDEAHTLGIVFEHFKQKNPSFGYSILGTDISSSVVDRATEGLYIGRPVERFRETRGELFKKYMVGDDEKGYRVLPYIKSHIKFKVHNLFNMLSGGQKFDLILLRNVLIYFTKEDQEKVLKNVFNCLSPRGFLIIGESESLNGIETNFESVSPLIYQPVGSGEKKDAA